jgi:hypothetical protein
MGIVNAKPLLSCSRFKLDLFTLYLLGEVLLEELAKVFVKVV